jgi:hypothetical protein
VDACNPLLQAHPTWARDEHEGRGISTSLTPVSGHLASPPFALAHALDPSGLGHAAHSLVGSGTPRSRNTDNHHHHHHYYYYYYYYYLNINPVLAPSPDGKPT